MIRGLGVVARSYRAQEFELQFKYIHRTYMYRKRKYKLALIVLFQRLTKQDLQNVDGTFAFHANPERKQGESRTLTVDGFEFLSSDLP